MPGSSSFARQAGEIAYLLATALLVLHAFLTYRELFRRLPQVLYSDFGRFYDSVHLWHRGESIYSVSRATWNPDVGVYLWNLNPPHFTLLLAPLGWLSLDRAHLVYLLANAAGLALAGGTIARALGLRYSPVAWIGIVSLVAIATPSLSLVATGQYAGLLTALTAWIWLQWRQGRWTAGAYALGFAWSLKVFFAPLIAYLLLRREWRAAGVAAITGLGCFLIGLAVFGWSEFVAWIRILQQVEWPWLVFNSSLMGPLTRYAHTTGGTMTPMILFGLALGAVMGFYGLWTASRARSIDHGLALLLTTVFLTFPTGWVYYWWVIVPPLVPVVLRDPRRWEYVSFLAWLVPTWLLIEQGSPLYATTVASLYFWSLLVLWTGLMKLARERA